MSSEIDFETRLNLVQIELDEIGKILAEMEKAMKEVEQLIERAKR